MGNRAVLTRKTTAREILEKVASGKLPTLPKKGIREKGVGEKGVPEKSVGEKSVSQKSIGQKSIGEENIGEENIGEENEIKMKFEGSIEIEKPIALVTQLFADPNNLKHYQKGFVRKELLSGRAGEEGAKSKMVYKWGKSDREMELIETVVSNQLPDSFVANYEHPMMDNTLRCRFRPDRRRVDSLRNRSRLHAVGRMDAQADGVFLSQGVHETGKGVDGEFQGLCGTPINVGR